MYRSDKEGLEMMEHQGFGSDEGTGTSQCC
jgi:hypothetical protein